MLLPQELLFYIFRDMINAIFGTEDLSPLYSVIGNKNEPLDGSDSHLVIPAGVEPAIFWMRTRRPRPLDDGTK